MKEIAYYENGIPVTIDNDGAEFGERQIAPVYDGVNVRVTLVRHCTLGQDTSDNSPLIFASCPRIILEAPNREFPRDVRGVAQWRLVESDWRDELAWNELAAIIASRLGNVATGEGFEWREG